MRREKLLPVVKSLLENKNQALLTGSQSRLEKLFSLRNGDNKAFENEKKALLARGHAAKDRKLKYRSQVTKVTTGPQVSAGNLVKLNVTEHITWWVEDSNSLRAERQQTDHQLILEYDLKWLIKEDIYRAEPLVATIPCPVGRCTKEPVCWKNRSRGYRSNRYNRTLAVSYAHKWWNGNNPAFRAFSVDCTNFISQVLFAGGIPMNYTGKQNTGWWYSGSGGESDKWSYSWAVAHSLRWYFASGKAHFPVEKVSSPEQLQLGDIICYDWDGDGVWQHNTVVVGYNFKGQPLVNAHTVSSQNRYWDYRESPAWSPNTCYNFWRILL